MIQETLFGILSGSPALTSLIGTNITPDVPTTNTSLPVVLFNVTNSTNTYATTGEITATEYTVQIDAWAVNMAAITSIMAAVRTALAGYRDGTVKGVFVTSENTSPEEEGFHGVQVFSVWTGPTANVLRTANATGTVTTGLNSVTLSACNHVLKLDCDGVTFDNAVRLDKDESDVGRIGLFNPANDQFITITAGDASIKVDVLEAGQLSGSLDANNITGVLPVAHGGTGVGTLQASLTLSFDAHYLSPGMCSFLRLSSTQAINVTGLNVSQAGGSWLEVFNAGSFAITFTQDNGVIDSPSARFMNPNSTNLILNTGEWARFVYDSVNSRWRTRKV